MRWAVLVAAATPPDLSAVCEATGCSVPVLWTDHTVAPAIAMDEPDGILVVGSDADLAAVAHHAHLSEHRVPIGLLPSGPSDLLRMFGLDRSGILSRLASGTRYPTDLGICGIGKATVPFIGHVVTRSGWCGALVGGREVQIETPQRSYEMKASRIVVSNVQHLDGHTVAPRSAIMDGMLDVQAITGSVIVAARTRRRSRRGLHLPDRSVWRRSAPRVTASGGPKWPVFADGRRIGSGQFTADLVPGAFDLWI